jgi:1,4-dihydroxy-2-naphthoate octaprenyltransferase
LNKWIIGARVKTLPAAISPVLVGTALATNINWFNALLALIVSLSLQISVNYANDYSDGIRGTDSNRVGPIRLVGSGLASAKSVKQAMFISFGIAAIAGLIFGATNLLLAITSWCYLYFGCLGLYRW